MNFGVVEECFVERVVRLEREEESFMGAAVGPEQVERGAQIVRFEVKEA